MFVPVLVFNSVLESKGKGTALAHQKKILVLESEKILVAGIFSLLTSRSEFDVTSTTFSSLACLEPSDNLQLEIVILDEELLAANILALIQLTDSYPNLRLIVLSLRDSIVNIIDKQTVPVKNASDLIHLLEGSPGKDQPD